MTLRHRKMLEIRMKETKRQLLEREVKVAVQQVLLKTCNETFEADDEEICLCEDDSLYDEEAMPIDQADDDEFCLCEGKPIYDEEVVPTDQTDEEEIYLYEGEPVYDEEVTLPDQEELLMITQNLHTTGKVSNTDNGNCENVVFDYVVQKLKPTILDHLHPHWLNTGSKVTKCESLHGVTSFLDVLSDKISLELPPDEQYYNADADQRAKEIKKIHEAVYNRIQKPKAQRDKHRKQRIFNAGDLVWIHLRFLKHLHAKLSPYVDDDNFDSRTSFVQPRENDTETDTETASNKQHKTT